MSENYMIDYQKILTYSPNGIIFGGGFREGAGDMLNNRGAFLKEILTGTNSFYCLLRRFNKQGGSVEHQIAMVGTSSDLDKVVYKRCCHTILLRNIAMFRGVEQITPEIADRGFEMVEDFYFNQFLTTGVLKWGVGNHIEDRVGFFTKTPNDPVALLRNFTVSLLGSPMSGSQTLSITNTEGLVHKKAMSNNPFSDYECSFTGSYYLLLSGDVDIGISSKLNRRTPSMFGRLPPSAFCRGQEGFSRASSTSRRREVFDMMFEDVYGHRGVSQ